MEKKMSNKPLKTLEGKVALVTGASSGIGRATAIELARRGAKVIASARRGAEIETLVAEIKSEGFEATAVVADVNVEQSVIDLVAKTISTYGRIDIAFNNAGTEGALSTRPSRIASGQSPRRNLPSRPARCPGVRARRRRWPRSSPFWLRTTHRSSRATAC
jgi:NAD(P)-dependent dehydrogenase (short-subunit alcohol dehydrogenase family)